MQEISKFDEQGKGITYVDNLITFVPKTIPGDIVKLKVTKAKKTYQEAKLIEIIKPSSKRKDAFCPFYYQCGGCDLQNLSYEDTLEYKKTNIQNILKKKDIFIEPCLIKNDHDLFYRNKIELKVVNKVIGFYEEKTNNIVKIDKCFITSKAINNVLKELEDFNIINGHITIRSNEKDELLIIIDSQDKINIDIDKLNKHHKIEGIIVNKKCFYGKSYLMEHINGIDFKVSYDAFFQVNPYVASKLFELIRANITKNDKVLDLYSGVGTLTLSASLKALKTTGIEVIPNAVKDATINAKLNNLKANFVLNKVEEAISKIVLDYNTIIIDPPRKGIAKQVLDILMNHDFAKIIYVSCDAQTLARDLSVLKNKYNITKLYILDMFSYTYHVECVCVLKLR